jgi:Dienelactone hydrolase and related enzymes
VQIVGRRIRLLTLLAAIAVSAPLWVVRAQAPTILLDAVPGDSNVFLAWAAPGPIHDSRVFWRASTWGAWRSVSLGLRRTAAVQRLWNDSTYQFRVEAVDANQDTLRSAVLAVAPTARQSCGSGDFLYCVPDFRERIQSLGFGTRDVACNGARVDSLSLDIPDCFFVGPGIHIVLDRRFDSKRLADLPSGTTRQLVQSVARYLVAGDSAWPFRRSRLPIHQFSVLRRVEPSEGFESEVDTVVAFDIQVLPGIRSRGKWYAPSIRPSKGVAIYVEGHGLTDAADEGFGRRLASRILAQGWEVITMDMLLEGDNRVDQTGFIASHDDLAAAYPSDSLFRLHFEPIRTLVDSIARGSRPKRVVVLGRSGGGWLASLYGLFDPRVAAYVTIAGGQPPSYMSVNRDYEFYFGRLFDAVPYEHILSVSGECGAIYFASSLDPTDNAIPVGSPLVTYIANAFAARGRDTFHMVLDPTHPEHSLSLMGLRAVDDLLAGLTRIRTEDCTAARAH